MSKLTLTDVGNILTAAAILNANNQKIEDAIDNTLSRDGTSPNEMNADIDINNHRLYNLPSPKSDAEPVRKIDLETALTNIGPILPITPLGVDVDIRAFGAVPGDSPFTAYVAAVKFVDALGGGIVRINDSYVTADTLTPGTINNNLRVIFGPKGKVTAAPGMATRVFRFDGPIAAPVGNLSIEYPNIDCSQGASPNGVGGDFCTAIDVNFWNSLFILNPNLYGGESPENNNADSGVSFVTVKTVFITGGRIRGFNDAGVYPSGDNTVGDDGRQGESCVITGVDFSRCKAAITAKRELNSLIFSDNTVTECYSGIQANEITGVVGPAKFMSITDNVFRRTLSQCARFRGPAKGRFSNNTVEDWGYSWDGSVVAGSNANAVMLDGASGVDITNNRFVLLSPGSGSWMRDQQHSIFMANVTFNSTLYTQGGNRIFGNYHKGLTYAYYEGTSTNKNYYADEIFDDVTTPFGGTPNAGSMFLYQLATSGSQDAQVFCRFNAATYPIGPNLISAHTSALALTPAMSGRVFTNDSATTRVDFTLPATALGLEYTFVCADQDGLRITAPSGSFIYGANQNSTSGGYMQITGATAPIAVVTLKAINSTIWVATSISGTWTFA